LMNNRKVKPSDRHVKVCRMCLWSILNIYTCTEKMLISTGKYIQGVPGGM
jgi:hypothetical protein